MTDNYEPLKHALQPISTSEEGARIIAEALAARPVPKVVVVRTGALGDTILTLPALNCLKIIRSDSVIMLCGSSWAEKLAPLCRGLYSPIPFDSIEMAPLFSDRTPRRAPAAFYQADLVIVYTARTGDRFEKNLRAVCGCPVLVREVSPNPPVHIALHLANAVSQVPFTSVDQLPMQVLEVPERLKLRLAKLLGIHSGQAFAAVHPGSGTPHKIMPSGDFARIIAGFRRRDIQCVLIEGPADSDACARVAGELPPGARIPVLRHAPVCEVAALLQMCGVFVGNDSGVAHLAAAAGARVRVMFRSTDPALWLPHGRDVKAVSPDHFAGFDPDALERPAALG